MEASNFFPIGVLDQIHLKLRLRPGVCHLRSPDDMDGSGTDSGGAG